MKTHFENFIDDLAMHIKIGSSAILSRRKMEQICLTLVEQHRALALIAKTGGVENAAVEIAVDAQAVIDGYLRRGP